MANAKNRTDVVSSSGNVFADLGLPGAEEKQTKVRLAVAINQIIDDKRMSQTMAAQLLDINQPKISALANYRLDGFSVERLMHFLNALGRDVEIIIRNSSLSQGSGNSCESSITSKVSQEAYRHEPFPYQPAY